MSDNITTEVPESSEITTTPTINDTLNLVPSTSPIQIPVRPIVNLHYDESDETVKQIFKNIPDLSSVIVVSATFVYSCLYRMPHTNSKDVMSTEISQNGKPQSSSNSYSSKISTYQPTNAEHGSKVLKTTIDFHLLDMDGVADTSNPSPTHVVMRFSLKYMHKVFKQHKPELAVREFVGVLVHELVHAYQSNGKGTADSGVIEGIADFVRLEANLAPPHWRKRTDCQWNAGYDATAYFFSWIDTSGICPNFTQKLNYQMLDEPWSEDMICTLTGYKVDKLWEMYCMSIKPEKPEMPIIIVTPTSYILMSRLISEVHPIQLPVHPTIRLYYDNCDKTVKQVLENVGDLGTTLMMAATYVYASLYGLDDSPATSRSKRIISSISLLCLQNLKKDKSTQAHKYAITDHGSKVLKTTIDFHLLDMDGVADTSNPSPTHAVMRFSLKYLQKVFTQHKPELAVREFVGVLVHELVHAYQSNGKGTADSGVIEGIADFVRLEANLAPSHWRKRTDCQWNAGYDATAYFFSWIDTSCICPNFTQKLNYQMLDESWDEDMICTLTGYKVEKLWGMYCKFVSKKPKNLKT